MQWKMYQKLQKINECCSQIRLWQLCGCVSARVFGACVSTGVIVREMSITFCIFFLSELCQSSWTLTSHSTGFLVDVIY